MADPTWYTDGLARIADAQKSNPPNAVSTDLDRLKDDLGKALADLNTSQAALAKAQSDLATCQKQLAAAPPKTANGQTLQPGIYVSAPAAAGIALGALALGGLGGYFGRGWAQKRKQAREEALEAAENPRLPPAEGDDAGDEEEEELASQAELRRRAQARRARRKA